MKVVLCNDFGWLFSKEAFSIYAPCMYKPTFENYKMQIKNFVLDPFVKIFVCEEHGQKVGILILKQSDGVSEIIGIAVASHLQHHGIGKYMIRKVKESEQLRYIKVQTDKEAIGFYRKCGFVDEKQVIKYPDGISVRYNGTLIK